MNPQENTQQARTIGNALFFAEVERLLAEGNPVRIRVHGTSMEPTLHDKHTEVELHPFTPGTEHHRPRTVLHRGDIILFRAGGGHILHRIVRTGQRLTTRGDNVWGIYEHPGPGEVLAVVQRIFSPEERGTNRIPDRSTDCRALRTTDCTTHLWRLRSRLRLAFLRPARRFLAALRRHTGKLFRKH